MKSIKVGKYTISIQAHGYQLSTIATVKVKDKETKEFTGETKEVVQNGVFCNDLDHVLDRLIHAEITRCDMKSIQDLIGTIDSLRATVREAVK